MFRMLREPNSRRAIVTSLGYVTGEGKRFRFGAKLVLTNLASPFCCRESRGQDVDVIVALQNSERDDQTVQEGI